MYSNKLPINKAMGILLCKSLSFLFLSIDVKSNDDCQSFEVTGYLEALSEVKAEMSGVSSSYCISYCQDGVSQHHPLQLHSGSSETSGCEAL